MRERTGIPDVKGWPLEQHNMSIRYTNVINHLPETKMRLYPTKVINIIGGPVATSPCFLRPSFCI